jgi:hypothetical protein
MIARTIRLLLASGFLAAVAHVAPVAERAALGITRVEDLAPEAIARPLARFRAACRIGRLSHRLESPSEVLRRFTLAGKRQSVTRSG